MNELRGYQKAISKATGVTDVARISQIEDCMRNDIFHSTLDWQSARQFNQGARDALALLQYAEAKENRITAFDSCRAAMGGHYNERFNNEQ